MCNPWGYIVSCFEKDDIFSKRCRIQRADQRLATSAVCSCKVPTGMPITSRLPVTIASCSFHKRGIHLFVTQSHLTQAVPFFHRMWSRQRVTSLCFHLCNVSLNGGRWWTLQLTKSARDSSTKFESSSIFCNVGVQFPGILHCWQLEVPG